MNNRDQALKARIKQVCNRWKRLVFLKGSSITLISTIAVLLTVFLLDSFLELSASTRFFFLVAIVTVFVISFFWTMVRPLLNIPTETQLARLIEEKHPDLEDRLVTAVELGGSTDPRVSSRLLLKLLDDARLHVQPLNLSKTLHKKGTFAWSSFALAFTLFLTVWVSTNLESFALKTDRIFSPWKFQNVALLPKFEVNPGNSRIPKGSAQEIRAEISGFEPEEVVLYYSTGDSSWNKTDMDITAEKGLFVYSFFDIENETRYYVKADDKLSDIFTFTVYDAPVIRRVDLTYDYPQYTGLKTRQEIDTGDVWAPEGTQVKISAITDKPLINAEVVLGDDANLSSKILADTVITASFKVTKDSYYKILITDTDGLTNDPPSEYYIHALPDQPPVLTIDRPGRDIKASMLEEVSISIKVQDDYGEPALKLFYTINGSDERQVDLKAERTLADRQTSEVDQFHEFDAEHLFYLEDFHIQPGDFLTYHVQAGDHRSAMNPETVTSEIYFVSVRSFDQEFFRPMSQGGSQGGGASSLGGRLSETQKEIIVATWKLQQKAKNLSQEDLGRNLDIIIESQKNLQEVTESTLMQMQQRSLFTRQTEGETPKLYTAAIEAMNKALAKLHDSKLKEALVHEREAFQNLLKAEAQIKRIQMQRTQAQGAGSQATIDELARLFDDEMDKLPNKYETLSQSQQQQQNQETNEALRKIKELARRQQQLNRQTRDLARNDIPAEEKKRRIEELRRKQEELRRQTQQLTRQMQRQGNSRQAQNDLRRATQEMRNASNNLRKDKTEIAAAKGGRALNNLKRIEDMLQRNQKESLRRQIEDIEQQFQQMADAQESLNQKIDRLKKQPQPDASESQEAEKNQARLKENLKNAQNHLNSVLRHARENKRELSREINKLSQEINKTKLDRKMQTAENLLKQKQFNSASQAGRNIQKNLEKLKEELANLGGAFAETDEEKLDLALNQTRRLRENLEALRKRALEELQKGENKDSGTQRQGAPGSKDRRAGPGETKGPEQQVDPRKFDWLNEQVAKNLRDLQRIQNSVQVDSSLSKNFRQLNRDMQGVVRTFKGGLPERFQLIENLVLDPLKALEADLAHKLETMKNREKLFLAREDKIPAEYQEMVEKYYEALSKTRKKQ